jgi:hypothetical protein
MEYSTGMASNKFQKIVIAARKIQDGRPIFIIALTNSSFAITFDQPEQVGYAIVLKNGGLLWQ